jgi:hypothetical protein
MIMMVAVMVMIDRMAFDTGREGMIVVTRIMKL